MKRSQQMSNDKNKKNDSPKMTAKDVKVPEKPKLKLIKENFDPRKGFKSKDDNLDKKN